MATCYSMAMQGMLDDSRVIGFPGLVDVDEADLWWSHYQVVFRFPQWWRLWYGGRNLRIDGY